MAVFIDTSAVFAILDADDQQHQSALGSWRALAAKPETPITSNYVSNYVVVETIALLARRLGFAAVREFVTRLVPALAVPWVDEELHQRSISVLLAASRRDLSLVDIVSFEVMRELGLDTAFAFDEHFAQQGFRCLP